MSSLTLERARANHEDIEAYERAIVAILEDKPRTVRGSVVEGCVEWTGWLAWWCLAVVVVGSMGMMPLLPPLIPRSHSLQYQCHASQTPPQTHNRRTEQGARVAAAPHREPDRPDPETRRGFGGHLRGQGRVRVRGLLALICRHTTTNANPRPRPPKNNNAD